jgi:flagellar basal body-associated protein FliL
MAEAASNSSLLAKVGLGALLGTAASAVFGMFFAGYVNLATPASPQNQSLEDRLAATGVLATEKEVIEEAPVLSEEEQALILFNRPKHSYYLFPIPFISNLKDSKKLLTIELAVSIYAPPLSGDSLLSALFKFDPAMRNVILAHLLTKSPDELVSREDRQKLSEELKEKLNKLILTGQQDEEAARISEVHIQKLVVG